MRVSQRQFKNFKMMCALLFCVVLIACSFTRSIGQTFSYVQTMSGTCVNTFAAEPSTEPTDPTEPEEPSKPVEPAEPEGPSGEIGSAKEPTTESETVKTGDAFNMGIWILTTQISLLALLILLFMESKHVHKEKRRQQ